MNETGSALALAIRTQCTYLQIFGLAKMWTTHISTTGSLVAYGAVWRWLCFALLCFPYLINKEAVSVICLRFFFCCVIKCSNKSNFTKKWFIIDPSSMHSLSWQESQGQELGATGQTTSAVRREQWESRFSVPLPYLHSAGPVPGVVLATKNSQVFPAQHHHDHPSWLYPQVHLLRWFKILRANNANQCVIFVFFCFEPALCILSCVSPSSLSGWWWWRWWKFKTSVADTYTA